MKQARYGKANEHNGWIPHDFWLEAGEKRAILDFHLRYPLEGYRRLTFWGPRGNWPTATDSPPTSP